MVSNEVELKELKKSFEKMDVNGDGVLSFDEICAGLQAHGYTDKEEIRTIFKGMDMDQNGQVE